MITQYKIQKDVGGYNNFGLQVSNAKYSATLAAATDTTLTVPFSQGGGAPHSIVQQTALCRKCIRYQ